MKLLFLLLSLTSCFNSSPMPPRFTEGIKVVVTDEFCRTESDCMFFKRNKIIGIVYRMCDRNNGDIFAVKWGDKIGNYEGINLREVK